MIRLSFRRAGSITLLALAAISLGAGGCTTELPIDGSGGGVAGSGTSGGPSCTSFPNDTALGNVTFTVKNNQAAPIYITGPSCSSRYRLAASLDGVFQDGERPTTEGTCEHPITPPPDCLGDSATPIEPGGTFVLEWGGLVYAKAALPDGCSAPADPQSLECYQGHAPRSGTLEVRVDLSPTGENCSGPGSCSATGNLFHATKSFQYPGETQVQVDVN